jgi:hypothetical protein
MMDRIRFDLEVKFASDKSGVFSGYGASSATSTPAAT